MVMTMCIGELEVCKGSIVSDFLNDMPVIESNTDLGCPNGVAEVPERYRHTKNVDATEEIRRKPIPRSSKHFSNQKVNKAFDFLPSY